MIESFRRILVHVDVMAAAHPALGRALDLARRTGASLTLIDVVPDVPRHARVFLPEDLQTLLVTERTERLKALAERTRGAPGPPVAMQTEVRVGQPAIEIVRAVLRNRHDVVLRSHASLDERHPRPLFDAVEMQLLRKCPCPVWLVGPDRQPGGRVVAAVNPNPEDETEQTLNRAILETALWLVEQESHELVVLHVWNAFGQELLAPLADPPDVEAYVNAARDTAQADLDALLEPFERRLERAHAQVRLERGEPGTRIPEIAGEEKAALVVMGTVARTGIRGFIMGNTAERVLGALPCSVLTVKPEGFVSPVSLDE